MKSQCKVLPKKFLSIKVKNKVLITIILAALVAFLCTSCGSSCAKTKRYWRKHRCVDVQKDTIQQTPQYAFVNNSIVILR